ncbi:hypothetical protein RB195_017239 [Necator americanus]|uniref:Metallo-beta-lactamase domain-containing protein n=1 Tax=Necator americanus TaxID=51031 RepID=A0ABR1C4B3_NECAM
MHLSTNLFIALALVLPVLSTPATTEQLRQWILENRKNIYGENSITDGDLASTILRLFGLERGGSTTAPSTTESTTLSTEIITTTPTTTTVTTAESTTPPTIPPIRDVCPFNAEPLMIGEDFSFCRASAIGDCPVGYLCDQSFVLGRSICCRDNRIRPMPNRPAVVRPSSLRPPFSWNTITPTASPKWNAFTTPKKAPWYIKDRTTWPSVYNRVTSEATSAATTTTEEITTTTTTEPSTTMTEEEIETSTLVPSTTTKAVNPWARVWSTTATPQNSVSVSVLQAGSLRPLRDGQSETVGAITLINDNGFLVLVDTGASSDTERLLQSLAKESVTLDQINTVVITHGHPSHMGNMNFFAQKPILFHSMEYIGRHVTPTELRERPYRKLSPHIELWKTPGHTQHDLTVLIHDVASYGTMAIVGDLIPNEALISERRDIMDEEGVWDSAIKRQNANLIICMADWIVPGHGQPFRVLPHYRQKAGCTRLLAQRHIAV